MANARQYPYNEGEESVPAMSTLVIQISGMHCDACVQAVHERLEALPGVTSVSVEVGAASVDFSETGPTKRDVFDAIRQAGRFEIAGFNEQP